MFTVYPTKMKAMITMHKHFETEEQANAYIASRNNPANYTIEVEGLKIEPTATKVEKIEKPTENDQMLSEDKKTYVRPRKIVQWKTSTDFSGAVKITRENVKHFYKKGGYIKVVDSTGKTLHIGRTKNMGKVFSNYVNCARYNQSYDFNLDAGDALLFKEYTE